MITSNPVAENPIRSTPETSQSERDELVLKHLPLVRAIAVRVYENLPVHVDVDDLVHAGIMGLFDAALKYNGEKQVSFHGYAKHRIKGAILDSLRDMDWASRDLRKRHKQLEAVMRELAGTLERAPTEAEIAEKMGMDVARWRQVAIEMRMVGFLSASTRAPESENQNAIQADQLAGQWYANMLGLGDLVPHEMQISAAKEIFDVNVMKFAGGQMGAANGIAADGSPIDNVQAKEVWAGTTLGFSALLLSEGMKDEAYKSAWGLYHVIYETKGYWFRTPEAWDITGNFRASMYMRPAGVWAMEMAQPPAKP